jgi:predicted amidohydrolase
MIREAAAGGADIIVLPEMFATPYTKHYMLKFKEPLLPDY